MRAQAAAAFCALALSGSPWQRPALAAEPSAREVKQLAARPAQSSLVPITQWSPPDLPTVAAAVAPDGAFAGWTPAEVERARAQCSAALRGLDAVVLAAAPLREGRDCGTPAPMQLIS